MAHAAVAGADPPALAGVEHRSVRARGLDVHVAEAGSADPVVLLHGWPQHWWCWRKVIPALAERHRVIAVDLRGHGWTSAPRDGYDKRELVADLLALLDALELERVRLAGHDWGAWVSMLAAMRAPERIEQLVVLSIPPPWQRASLRRAAASWRVAYQPFAAAPLLGPRLQAGRGQRFLRTVFRGGSGEGHKFAPDDLEPYLERFRDRARARAGSRYYRTFLSREVPALLTGRYARGRLTVPTLLMYGSRDPVVGPAFLRDAGRRADALEIERIEGAGHWLPEERPQLVADRSLAFFDTG